MTPEDIDRLLAHNEEILPSSGFGVSVMEAVLQEATAPPLLAFPWRRALPGLAALLAAFAVAIRNVTQALNDPRSISAFEEQIREFSAYGSSEEILWIAVAIVLTVLSTGMPLLLMRSRLWKFGD